jgi:hypothetical protein
VKQKFTYTTFREFRRVDHSFRLTLQTVADELTQLRSEHQAATDPEQQAAIKEQAENTAEEFLRLKQAWLTIVVESRDVESERMGEFHRAMFGQLMDGDHAESSTAWDLYTVRGDIPCTDERRTAAAGRVADQIPRPIARQRWHRVEPQLNDEAKRHEREPKQELRERKIAALFDRLRAIEIDEDALDGRRPWDPEILGEVRAALNDALTVDFLSTGWRGSDSKYGREWEQEKTGDPQPDCLSPDAGLDREAEGAEVLALLERAELSKRETEVVLAISHEVDRTEIAEQLGIARSTVDVLWARGKKKIKKIANA